MPVPTVQHQHGAFPICPPVTQVVLASCTFAAVALSGQDPLAQVQVVTGLLAATLVAISVVQPGRIPRANITLTLVGAALQALAAACTATLTST